MKKTLAYISAAVVALCWAADGRAQNLSDDAIAAHRPYEPITIAAHRQNDFIKISTGLPLNDFELSGHRPNDFIRIAEELPFRDNTKFAGFRPNDFIKISTHLPDRSYDDDIARHGLEPQSKISGHLPPSFTKISSQFPSNEK